MKLHFTNRLQRDMIFDGPGSYTITTDETDFLLCDCGSYEHQMLFYHDRQDNEVYMSVHLVKYGFWKRVKIALKYLFGYRSRYGAWDCVSLSPDHIPQFKKVIETLEKQNLK